MKIFIAFITLIICNTCLADKSIPYYASLKFSEVNVRKGPNSRYPISWVYNKKGEPLEIIAQFEQWYRIRDISGDEGWVKSVMFSKKRSGIIIKPKENDLPTADKTFKSTNSNKFYATLYKKADNLSRAIGHIEPSIRVSIKECKKQWCKIQSNNVTGWIEKQYLWGVYANEEFK